MDSTRLPLSVCLLDPDPTAVGILAAIFGPIAAEIVTTTPPTGALEPERWRQCPPETDIETARGMNTLMAEATQPWILVVPAGMRPAPATVPWLLRQLPGLAAGTYIGLGPLAMPDNALRPWLFDGHRNWWDGPPVRPAGDRGEDLPATLLTSLAFQAPSPLPDWFGIEETDLCRYITGLQDVLQRFPLSQRAHYELAECLRLAGRHMEAYFTLQRAWAEPQVKDAWVPGELPGLLARIALDLGEADEAMAFAREAVAQQPYLLEAWELIVRQRFARDGAAAAVDDAEGWWIACLSGAPEALRTITEQPVVMAEACRHVVWALSAAGRLAEARSVASIGEAPPDLPVHVAIAGGLTDAAIDLLTMHQPAPDIARRSWEPLIVKSRTMPDLLRGMLWSSLGTGYYRQLALQCFDRVVAEHPDQVDGYWRRALVRAMKPRDLPEARNDLYRALRIEPRWAMLWQKLAEVCRLLGDEPGAQTAFREAHRLAARPLGR